MINNLAQINTAIDFLSPPAVLLVFAVAFTLMLASYVVHEGAHALIGRVFGAHCRFGFLPLRGKSKLWMVSLMGVTFDDASVRHLARWQIRLIAAAGPAWDLMFGAACLNFALDLPVPNAIRFGVAGAGAVIVASTVLMNIVPLPIGNDGWRVLFPDVPKKAI